MAESRRGRRGQLDEEELASLIAGYEKSGMSAWAFARERGIPVSTFYKWLRRSRQPTVNRLVRVAVRREHLETPDGAQAEIVLRNGRVLRIPLYALGDDLGRIATALEEEC